MLGDMACIGQPRDQTPSPAAGNDLWTRAAKLGHLNAFNELRISMQADTRILRIPCFNCQKRISLKHNPVICKECTGAFYCSEQCLVKHKPLHHAACQKIKASNPAQTFHVSTSTPNTLVLNFNLDGAGMPSSKKRLTELSGNDDAVIMTEHAKLQLGSLSDLALLCLRQKKKSGGFVACFKCGNALIGKQAKKCSGCDGGAMYCSKECQKKDWQEHKMKCKTRSQGSCSNHSIVNQNTAEEIIVDMETYDTMRSFTDKIKVATAHWEYVHPFTTVEGIKTICINMCKMGVELCRNCNHQKGKHKLGTGKCNHNNTQHQKQMNIIYGRNKDTCDCAAFTVGAVLSPAEFQRLELEKMKAGE